MATVLARGFLTAKGTHTAKHGNIIGKTLTIIVCTLAALTLMAASVRFGTDADPILEPIGITAK